MSPSPPAAPVVDLAAEGLQGFAAAFFQAAGPALTTSLNRPLEVEVIDVTSSTVHELLEELDAPWVFVEIAYQRGLTGTHWMVLSRRNGLALAGDPGAEVIDFESRHKESIRTTVNQLLHASSASLLALASRSVAYAPVTVHVTLRDEELPGDLVHQQRVWIVRARAVGDGLTIDMAVTVDEALAQTIASLGAVSSEAGEGVVRRGGDAAPAKIDMILDVTLPVAVELGRARLQIQDILKLAPGSVIALDKSAGDPVELFINDRAIAKGEVVIIDENFGVRLTSIVTTSERIRTLR
ncbi:MAG: flagellar motor switch protein FliN [Candidatus Rokubacteria bacterium]|nr:flagellar motor switch protein FliN [Candidatus Rokubacteria bacterium]